MQEDGAQAQKIDANKKKHEPRPRASHPPLMMMGPKAKVPSLTPMVMGPQRRHGPPKEAALPADRRGNKLIRSAGQLTRAHGVFAD